MALLFLLDIDLMKHKREFQMTLLLVAQNLEETTQKVRG